MSGACDSHWNHGHFAWKERDFGMTSTAFRMNFWMMEVLDLIVL